MDRRLKERRRLITRERGRRRAGLIFLCALAVVAVIVFVWLRSSSVFAIERISAPVTHHIATEKIAEAVAPARGVSLLKVSTGDLEKRLSSLPYARAVHVYRAFPNGLDIHIEEYEPAARVQDGAGRAWLVADDGRLLEKAGQGASSLLPLIVGPTPFQAKGGDTIPQVLLAAMPVALLLENPDVSSSLPKLDHISISTGGDVVVILQGGTQLRLGEPVDLKQKMMDAAGIIESYLRDGKILEYVDASAGDRLAVKAK